MKNTMRIFTVTTGLFLFFAPAIQAQEVKTISGVDAAAKTAYFDFETGKETPATSQDWDVAFERTTILVNGGSSGQGKTTAQILTDVTFESVDAYPSSGFRTDTQQEKAIPTGSGNGWYEYNMADHGIHPIPGRIILIKTSGGKYVKLEILGYYNKSTHNSANYAFRYSFL